MVKCRRKHFLFLYEKQGILTLWIPVLAAVAGILPGVWRGSVRAAEPWKGSTAKAPGEGIADRQLGQFGDFVNVPEGVGHPLDCNPVRSHSWSKLDWKT